MAASVAYLETRVDNVNLTNNGQYLSTLKQVCFHHVYVCVVLREMGRGKDW